MKKTTKEENKEIEQKLKYLKLDLDNIPEIFDVSSKIKYKPLKEYDNSNYKVYQYISVKDIDIYITPTTRSEDTNKKYKLAKPLLEYLKTDSEENIETYIEFMQMLKRLNIDEIEELEKTQKQFQKHLPYEIKYKNNFIWDIYYSETENKYFMMFPSKEEQVESLFYIISKKISSQNKKKDDLIYVPINNKESNYSLLKRTEISDLENYLWYFTGEWPNIYEVQDKNKNKELQIIGQTKVYEQVQTLYKIVLKDKEEAQKKFKLLKAIFILQSNMEQEYNFKTGLSEEGDINFYYNHNQITYEILPEFIKTEIEKKKEKLNSIIEQIKFETERWILLKEAIQKQTIEYLNKEKEITLFLECKKSFFGRVSYFFNKKKKNTKNKVAQEQKSEEQNKIDIEEVQIEQKELYTIEDLLKIGLLLEKKEKEYKDKLMDIKALEIKKDNLENKIKNATLYINEIESHRKSIFDFWRFTNKNEKQMLNQGEGKKEDEENKNKIKKVFNYEEDIEDLGIKIDKRQRNLFNQKEFDAIFAVYQDTETFNMISKNKKSKKDDKQIENRLSKIKQKYEEEYEQIKEKDFDIFGSVVEDKTKIKILKNNKHREIEKSLYKILNIHLDTSLEEYKDNIIHYEKILEEAYQKTASPYSLSSYQISNKTIDEEKWIIMDLDENKEILKTDLNEENIFLNKVNIKENMPIIFYSNIMFYDNLNKTLPEGIDISTQILLDLQQYELKLVSRKDFKANFLEDEFKNIIKDIQVYEYDLIRKER